MLFRQIDFIKVGNVAGHIWQRKTHVPHIPPTLWDFFCICRITETKKRHLSHMTPTLCLGVTLWELASSGEKKMQTSLWYSEFWESGSTDTEARISPPFILMVSTQTLPGYLQYKILKLHVVLWAGSRWTFFCICCVQAWLCTLFLGERKSFFSASSFLFLWSS